MAAGILMLLIGVALIARLVRHGLAGKVLSKGTSLSFPETT